MLNVHTKATICFRGDHGESRQSLDCTGCREKSLLDKIQKFTVFNGGAYKPFTILSGGMYNQLLYSVAWCTTSYREGTYNHLPYSVDSAYNQLPYSVKARTISYCTQWRCIQPVSVLSRVVYNQLHVLYFVEAHTTSYQGSTFNQVLWRGIQPVIMGCV